MWTLCSALHPCRQAFPRLCILPTPTRYGPARRQKALLSPGAIPLSTACSVGQPAAVRALLAAGATCEVPSPRHGGLMGS